MKFSMNQIWKAVDDPMWQITRISMKGTSTQNKLWICQHYYETYAPRQSEEREVDIRIDNYLKALCRGGQLFAGSGLDKALETNWKLGIKKN